MFGQKMGIKSIKRMNLQNVLFVITKSPICRIICGIEWTINVRVKKTVIIDGTPKMMAVLNFTSPFLKYVNDPTKLVEPTIKREYVVANTASKWKRYTKTGTVNMLPPPPISPKEIPISIEAIYPAISIYLI